MRYKNSVDALRQLLESSEEETNCKYASEENTLSSSSASCSITQAYEDIFYSANGAAYYFVEVTCSDGIHYGIQAYGERKLERYIKKLTDIHRLTSHIKWRRRKNSMTKKKILAVLTVTVLQSRSRLESILISNNEVSILSMSSRTLSSEC